MANIFDDTPFRPIGPFNDDVTGGIVSATERELGKTFNAQGKQLRFPIQNLDKSHGWIHFRELEEREERDASGNDTLKTRSFPTGNVIIMYLPKEGIQVKDNAQYQQASLGLIGNIVENADITNFNAVNSLNYATKSVTDAFDAISNPQEANKAIITKVIQQAKMITPENVNAAARNRIKRTANPYLRAIFEQVNRRTFNYTFELVPSNPLEARRIRQIVSFFRKSLYPEVEGLEGEGQNFTDFAYKFPNKFQIEYYFNGKRIGHRLLPCYLENVSVSFSNQGSLTFYPDGEFISTKIDLQFTEERALNKNDVDPINFSDGVSY